MPAPLRADTDGQRGLQKWGGLALGFVADNRKRLWDPVDASGSVAGFKISGKQKAKTPTATATATATSIIILLLLVLRRTTLPARKRLILLIITCNPKYGTYNLTY